MRYDGVDGKNGTPVTVPLKGLSLDAAKLVSRNPGDVPTSYKYDLIGVVCHLGQTASTGHYVTYAKDMSPTSDDEQQQQHWVRFSDQHVTRISINNKELDSMEMRRNAYLLFLSAVTIRPNYQI